MTSLHVAISGSSGMIGSALRRRLSDSGHRVSRLTRPASESKNGGNAIVWEPALGLSDPTQLDSVDAVVHLAGRNIATKRWTDEEKRKIRDSRVQATERLVQQICQLATPPRSFISASAIGIYGDCQDCIVDEATPAADDFLASVAKDWENACTALKGIGTRVAHPRFGMVLSRSGGALAKMLPLFRWGLGGRLGSGDQYWSWIALHDCVEALLWLIENANADGPYNLVSPQSMTNAEFTAALAKALGKPAVLPAPKFALRLALGEMADALLLSSCRARPRRLLDAGFSFQYIDLAQFLDDEING